MGTGTRVLANEKIHNQGNIITTDNALDLAIDGDGFFKYRSKMEQLHTPEMEDLSYRIWAASHVKW